MFAVVLGGITQGYLWHSHGMVLDAVDVAAGAVACLALWWRRAHPMAVFVLAFAANTFSPLALGAGLVAVCTAASRLRGRALTAVVVLTAAASVVFPLVNPSAGEIVKVGFPAFLLTVIAFGWGLYLRARRELVASLRERAQRLEADQQRSAEQAREAERRRIAREMHDVLAHRLSLLSQCPGAFPPGLLQAPRRPGYPLQYPPLPPPSGHPVRDRHADTLAGVQLTRQPRRFGAPLLPAPRVGRRRLGRCGLVRKGLFVSAEH